MSAGVQVRGNATVEELAAVVALLTQFERREHAAEPDRYARWRSTRLAALEARPSE